ncbi:hypothetical protein KSP40_PGU009356 [Platanthera guangdongensis]|uniref:SPT2 chromatin protein n=1 Tax=Platanthera guangdongensis TaxID=2320717 RepID=A0ABR2LE75_9ASPA
MTLMQGHYGNGFSQNNEEYENEYDDYEDDDIEDDADDDEDKVEEQQPNEEELEFLKVREKLKEKFRQKLKIQNAQYFCQSSQSQDKKRASTKNSFGSFFGPSQPVIASRILDESRSIRETQHVTSKAPNASSGHREGFSSVASSEKKNYEHHQRPKVNEVKMKAQALKDMRDYSFLFSDDTDLPDKEPPPPASRHTSAPRPLARSAQTPLESKIPLGKPLKSVSNGRESNNTVSASRAIQTKVSTKEVQVSRHIPSSSEPRKPLPKAMPSKVPLNSNAVGQVMGTKKLNGKPENIPSTSKPYNPSQNHYVEQRRMSQAADRSKPAPKQAPTMKSQPPKTIPSRDISDERLKKRPVKRTQDEDDEGDAIQMIRNMFRYNPSRYSGVDDDDSDMEAGFSQIEQEELRSAQIARKEDEEQLRLIEEEERRERMRKKQKMNRR